MAQNYADTEQIESKQKELLRKVEDYLQMDNKDDAQKLVSRFTQQKKQTVYLEQLAQIFLRLSLELERAHDIRQILSTYRKLTARDNIGSLKIVLGYYRDLVEKRFSRKIRKLDKSQIQSIQDVESQESSEDLLQNSFNQRERIVRDELKDLMKMLWDGYKSIIDYSKGNTQLEDLYFQTIKKALKFTNKYRRVQELKRFVGDQRNLLNRNPKDQSNQKNLVSLESSKTIQSYIDIRFFTYGICHQLGMYQECFKCLEDINFLMGQMKRKKQNKLIDAGSYYEKLSELFWDSGMHQYHAFFYFQHYIQYLNTGKVEQEKLQQKTDKLLLAILAIPNAFEDDRINYEKKNQLKKLILDENQRILSKKDMIDQFERVYNNLEFASEEVRKIYRFFKNNQENLQRVSEKVQQLRRFLGEERNQGLRLYQYIVEDNVLYKVLVMVSKIYISIKLEEIEKILNFVEKNELRGRIMNLIQNQNAEINCKIDLQKDLVNFIQRNQYQQVDPSNRLIHVAQEAQNIVNQIQSVEPRLTPEDISAAKEYLERHTQERPEIIRNISITQKVNEKLRQMYQNQMTEYREFQKKMQDESTRREIEKEKQEMLKKKLEFDNMMKRKREILDKILKSKGNQVVRINGEKIERLQEAQIIEIDEDYFKETLKKVEEQNKKALEFKTRNIYTRVDHNSRARKQLERQQLLQIMNQEDNYEEIKAQTKQHFESELKLSEVTVPARYHVDSFFAFQYDMRKKAYDVTLDKFRSDIQQFKDEIYTKVEESIKKEEEEYQQRLDEKAHDEQMKRENDISRSMQTITRKDLNSTDSDTKPAETVFQPGSSAKTETIASKIQRGAQISRIESQPTQTQAPKEEEKKEDDFIQVKGETRFQRNTIQRIQSDNKPKEDQPFSKFNSYGDKSKQSQGGISRGGGAPNQQQQGQYQGGNKEGQNKFVSRNSDKDQSQSSTLKRNQNK